MQKGKVVETIRDLTLAKDPYTKNFSLLSLPLKKERIKSCLMNFLPKCYGNVKTGFIKSRFYVRELIYGCISGVEFDCFTGK